MKSKELIADFLSRDRVSPQELLFGRLLVRQIADSLDYATLPNGEFLHGPTDHRTFLHECADELREAGKKVCACELSEAARVSVTPELLPVLELRTRPKVTASAPQRRWDEFCHDCGHIHVDDSECGFPIGGGRICKCAKAVLA
jgi:hypothetical protein